MLRLSAHDLQATTAQLDQAVYNHDQWYKNVQRVLIAQLPPDVADLEPDAHRHCRFGQWYDGEGRTLLGDHDGFAALGEAHKQMHKGAAQLLQRSADKLPIAVSSLDEFYNLLDRMRLEIQSLRGELTEMVHNRDPLTGARNRASLLSDLREQHALVRRGMQDCALVMIDLDHFKDVNDRNGHAAGDAVLTATVRCLQAGVRPYDHVYRFGGEEFLLTMPQTTRDAAGVAAERLRAAVASQEVRAGAGVIQVTASFGVAMLDAETSVEASLDRADKALYRAKNAGRNRVEQDVPLDDG